MNRRAAATVCAFLVLVALLPASPRGAAAQESYQRISGEGSTWSQNAIDAMRANIAQFGITVDYAGVGSTTGRTNWLRNQTDFAASDIPFQFVPEDGSEPEDPDEGSYAYIPVTAGGTAFMYNLTINGERVTNLRLSGENVAKIFTGAITEWNDPALAADNPGLTLPARTIIPVVRADSSGSSAQFTQWLIAQHGGIWQDYCNRSGRAPACGVTSNYPTIAGMIGQTFDTGVAAYVSGSFAEGAIGYINYSYALGAGFPVAKVLNTAGYYTEPTPENVAVSLLQARINQNSADPTVYLTQELDGVYNDADPRNYPLSSYSYFILRTRTTGQFNEAKGRTLGAFAYYAMCEAQQSSASLGYSPIPINLVQASFDQIRLIPGVEVQNIDIRECNNPTFSPDGSNLLAANAPQPQECDRAGPNQCPDGTGGARTATRVNQAAGGGQGGAGGGESAAGGGGGAAAAGGGAGPAGAAAAGTDADGDGVVDAGSAPVECDPDTGVCGPAGAGGATDGVETAAAAGAASTVLDAPAGWSSSQALILLITLFTIALVVAPALMWTRLSRPAKEKP